MKKTIIKIISIISIIILLTSTMYVSATSNRKNSIRPNVTIENVNNSLKKKITFIKPEQNKKNEIKNISVPVLLYHEVNDNPQDVYSISTNDFREQMQYLKDNQYIPISITKFDMLMDNKINVRDKKYVLITFDDGCLNAFENAVPILKSFNFEATFFITTSIIDTDGYINMKQLKQLNRDFDVQSHTFDHPWLTNLNYAEQIENLQKANNFFDKNLNKRVRYIAYPHGDCNIDTVIAAKEVGMKLGFICNDGASNSLDNPMAMNRQIVWRGITIKEFEVIIK